MTRAVHPWKRIAKAAVRLSYVDFARAADDALEDAQLNCSERITEPDISGFAMTRS
jgi:hypothetical protein